jgi:type II secretion system protein J
VNQKITKSAPTRRRARVTLLEILVASIVGAFVAATATSALRSTISSRQKITDYTAAAAQLRFAAEMIRRDLTNFYRDPDLNNVKLVAYSDFNDYGAADNIVFHTVNRVKARPLYPEGDVYEVEYGLLLNDENTPFLVRRLWPNPVIVDPALETEIPPMGVVTIVGENIVQFDVLFYYEDQWVEDWPEEMEELPALISVTLALLPKGRPDPLRHNFFISFPRWPGAENAGAQIGMEGSTPAPAAPAAPGATGGANPGGANTGPGGQNP